MLASGAVTACPSWRPLTCIASAAGCEGFGGGGAQGAFPQPSRSFLSLSGFAVVKPGRAGRWVLVSWTAQTCPVPVNKTSTPALPGQQCKRSTARPWGRGHPCLLMHHLPFPPCQPALLALMIPPLPPPSQAGPAQSPALSSSSLAQSCPSIHPALQPSIHPLLSLPFSLPTTSPHWLQWITF